MPNGNHSKFEAFRRKFRDKPKDDEPSDTEQAPQVSGSLEIFDVQPDLEVPPPQTRASTKAGQLQV